MSPSTRYGGLSLTCVWIESQSSIVSSASEFVETLEILLARELIALAVLEVTGVKPDYPS